MRPGLARPRSAGPIWERYLAVVERELGVPREALRPEMRFVEDLGAN